jgi:leader peptidase (prepilin peptidase)/N-methyltransferase
LSIWPIEVTIAGYGLLGLILGSFLSMLSYRLIQHLDSDTPALMRALVLDRSRCPHCQSALSFKQLIPLFSWLRYHLAAPCCGKPISWRYPIIEIATAIITAITAAQHITGDTTGVLGLSLQGWALLFLSWTLITIAITDMEHQIIPDRLSLPLLWLGLLLNTSDSGITPLNEAVWGAALGYTSLWLLFQTHRALTGKEGMGYGDFKLSAALGAWLGAYALVPIFIMAGLLAILVMGSQMLWKGKESQPFAFGPWLVIAGWLVMMGWSPI